MTPEEAAAKYHWLKYDKASNTIELFLDHHSLSWARSCEAGFVLEHLLHIRPNYGKMAATQVDVLTNERLPILQPDSEKPGEYKPVYIENRKPWFLDFGEFMHYMFECFYTSFIHTEKDYVFNKMLQEDQKCLNLQDFLEIGKKVWLLMDMDWYKDHGTHADQERWADLNGWPGVMRLLSEYYVYYMDLRLRVVDTEIIFGYNREVPIGEFYFLNTNDEFASAVDIYPQEWKVICYLTGRIDLVIDNGHKIGPVDHKNARFFQGDESDNYDPQDAITGYIYSLRCMLKDKYPAYFEKGREALSAWVYHISAKEPSQPRDKSKKKGPRFKCTPIDKTPSQIEAFKERQLSTFKRICELLFNNKTPEWNTNICSYMFGRDCQFKPLHKQPPEEWNNMIKAHYVIGEAWDPKNRDSDKIDKIIRKEGKEKMKENAT